MKTKLTSFTLLTAALAAFATAGFSADQNKVSSSDQKFIKEAGASGMAEVKLSELAVKKATRADVREFAQMMVSDHNAVNQDLTGLAQRKGVELSTGIDPDAASKYQKLEDTTTGNDFDNAYLKQMQSDHKKAISDFEDAQKKADDGDIKAFADKTLPGLKKHLDKVEQLLGKK